MTRAAETSNEHTARVEGTTGVPGDDARERLLAGLPVTERRLQLAGVSTAVLEGGDGPPVVCCMPGEFAALWMRVIPDLVTTHRVVAPDLPGHGASEVADGPLDADHVLAWLGELIEQTCPIPPALVGHGPGGALAARFAIAHSDRLVGAGAGGRARPGSIRAGAGFRARPDRLPGATDRAHPRRGCSSSASSIWTGCASRWASAGSGWRPTPWTGPDAGHEGRIGRLMRQLGLPAIPPTDLDRIAGSHHPDLGPPGSPGALQRSPRPPAPATAGRCT